MDRITVAVGDVHGCIEELDELLKMIQYKPDHIRLIFLGDLMDRGPDPVGCVRRVRELDADCLMGNHEEKHLRWRKHEKNRERTGKANPMKRMADEEIAANEALSDEDWTWLKSLPIKLHLGHKWWAVHAGCEPRFSLERQPPAQIMRVRYVDQNGIARALNPDKSQPENTVYWDMQWHGPESIIYGHCVHDLKHPRFTSNGSVRCVGIDTGCVFGGHLTAAIFQDTFTGSYYGLPEGQSVSYDDFKIATVQVKAKQKYYAGYGEE